MKIILKIMEFIVHFLYLFLLIFLILSYFFVQLNIFNWCLGRRKNREKENKVRKEK